MPWSPKARSGSATTVSEPGPPSEFDGRPTGPPEDRAPRREPSPWGQAPAPSPFGPGPTEPPRAPQDRPPSTWGPRQEVPGGATYPRQSTATPALVLSVIGLACCLTGPIGMIMGASDLRAIDRGLTDPSRRGAARAAVIIGAISSFLLFGMLLLWLVFGATALLSGTGN